MLYMAVSESLLPRFAEAIPNVTVTVGRDALLACVVDNLKGYKVSDICVLCCCGRVIVWEVVRVTMYSDCLPQFTNV